MRSSMPTDSYRQILKSWSSTQSGFGRWLGVHPVTGKTWGQSGPPPPVAKLMTLMVALDITPEEADRVIQRARSRGLVKDY